jgi:hypothetical protein
VLLLGYYLGRFMDNKLALSGDATKTLEQFYKASTSWAEKGSLNYKVVLKDGTSVIATTTALSGREDQFYQYDIQFGLKPVGNFRDIPAPPARKLRDFPKLPEPISMGQKIRLADGSEAEVVGKLSPEFRI